MEEIEELKNLCKPISDYLKKHYNPHTSIIIDNDRVRLIEDVIYIPTNYIEEEE